MLLLARAARDIHRQQLVRTAALGLHTSGPRVKLFSKQKPNDSRRQQIVAATVSEALTATLASGLIKDRGFANGAAVRVCDVQLTKDVHCARVLWEPMDVQYKVDAVQRALERRKGILKAHVNSYVNQKWAIDLEFLPIPKEDNSPVAQKQAMFAALRADVAAAEQRHAEEADAPDSPAEGAEPQRT